MRLVHLSDLHLGFRQFQRQTPAGINQREADVAYVFRGAIEKIVSLRPDLVLVAGDVFHHVRPSNPAILDAFSQFARLTQVLPDAIVVMVAGNHDTPRAAETGSILRLFRSLGIHVVEGDAERLSFASHDLSILAVPHMTADRPALTPDASFGRNILLMHAEVEGMVPQVGDGERVQARVTLSEINPDRWSYVALGNSHVFQSAAPNACYSGAIEYTSNYIWSELQQERGTRVRGKGIVEFDLESGRRTFHSLQLSRALVEMPQIQGRGLVAVELDQLIRTNVESCHGGIDDKIVRQLIWDVPRHVVRELDHRALRDYRRRALYYSLDTRRPDVVRLSASGAPGRRATLLDTVRDMLRSRELPSDVDREALIELGVKYLREAENLEHDALVAPADRT